MSPRTRMPASAHRLAIGVWARELEGPARAWLLGLVALLWMLILVPWYQYRHQHLVPLGNGAYRIENKIIER